MTVKVLAIIPARGGSKGVPKKNSRKIAGKPLVVWSIQQALASQTINKVIVSTDDREIAEISINEGAEVPFLRPMDLASDTASTEPVLLHALEWLKDNQDYVPDVVVLLQPISKYVSCSQ